MKTLLLLAPFVLLAGCAASVPVAENFPTTSQRLARTAKHWDVIAADVASQTSATLQNNVPLRGRPVVLSDSGQRTAFNTAFRNFLTTHMVQSGVPVNVCKSEPADKGELDVHHDFQFVKHAKGVYYRPGMWTALALGVVAVRAVAVSSDLSSGDVGRAVLGAGLAGDAVNYFAPEAPSTEIIITTTIAENNRFLMRRSDVYYVPSEDEGLYVKLVSSRSMCPDAHLWPASKR